MKYVVNPSGLPVFAQQTERGVAFYTPGHLLRVPEGQATSLVKQLSANKSLALYACDEHIRAFLTAADEVRNRWKTLEDGIFRPTSLLVYLHRNCNSKCSYCYVQANNRGVVRAKRRSVTPGAVRAASDLVAMNCQSQQAAFHLIAHGGGEPTSAWPLLKETVRLSRKAANAHGVSWFGRLATNGQIPDTKSLWVAETFNHVGLSCDGPPDIQNRQRPHRDNLDSSSFVTRFCRVLREVGTSFSVRATITPESCGRQEEIALYLIGVLGAREIRFEPVYGQGPGMFAVDDAERFVDNFLAAQRVASAFGANLTLSGVQLDDIHGPYCDVGHQTLHLLPDDTFTACFFGLEGRTRLSAMASIGEFDPLKAALRLDYGRVASLRKAHFRVPERCKRCVNQYHCARDCPDICHIRDAVSPVRKGGFRCHVSRSVAERWIKSLAMGETQQPAANSTIPASDAQQWQQLQQNLPGGMDCTIARRGWVRAVERYGFNEHAQPKPVWAEQGFTDNGERAWSRLTRLVSSRQGPISVYVHVPFCRTRCPFCDCLSYRLPHRPSQEPERYVDQVIADLLAWMQTGALANRPVTTIHLGGGTPDCLHPDLFVKLVKTLGTELRVNEKTEWAIETTEQGIDSVHAENLRKSGFRRIHVGVQSLQQRMRQILGRRTSRAQTLSRLKAVIERGGIVSVDLLYGLPGQRTTDLLDDISRLAAIGIHGVSLYHLNATHRNLPFMRRHGLESRSRNRLIEAYLQFQLAAQVLESEGYKKNHFTHFALPADHNTYYHYGIRGEDLLALGASADGRLGDYAYRYLDATEFMQRTAQNQRGLKGGVKLTATGKRLDPLINGLMAGFVAEDNSQKCQVPSLWQEWAAAGLVLLNKDAGGWLLTNVGAWFIADMLNELRGTEPRALNRLK